MKNMKYVLVNQMKTLHKTINKLNKMFQDTEKKVKTLKEDRHRLDADVMFSYSSFIDEGIIVKKNSEAKVFRLSEIEDSLRKWAVDMELQINPSTPPKVLEEWRKVATEAMMNIGEAKALCAKAVEQVS